MTKETICPFCKKQPAAPKPLWPFCSLRCKQGDLGLWASGGYAIPGKPVSDAADLEELEKALADDHENEEE